MFGGVMCTTTGSDEGTTATDSGNRREDAMTRRKKGHRGGGGRRVGGKGRGRGRTKQKTMLRGVKRGRDEGLDHLTYYPAEESRFDPVAVVVDVDALSAVMDERVVNGVSEREDDEGDARNVRVLEQGHTTLNEAEEMYAERIRNKEDRREEMADEGDEVVFVTQTCVPLGCELAENPSRKARKER